MQDESAIEVREFPRSRPAFVQLLQRLRGSGPDASFLTGGITDLRPLQMLALAAIAPSLIDADGVIDAFLFQNLLVSY